MTPMEIIGALTIAVVFALFAAWVITDLDELCREQMLDDLWAGGDQAWDRENQRIFGREASVTGRRLTASGCTADNAAPATHARFTASRDRANEAPGFLPLLHRRDDALRPPSTVFPREWVPRRPVLFDQDNDAA